jgi:hypothetical protein
MAHLPPHEGCIWTRLQKHQEVFERGQEASGIIGMEQDILGSASQRSSHSRSSRGKAEVDKGKDAKEHGHII